MKMLKPGRLTVLFALSFGTMVSHASSGWTDHAHVIELVPTIHLRFKVNIDVSQNPGDCKQKQWFYQDYAAPGAREMYRALLEAVSSDKKVRVYVTGRCDINNYSEISSVGIRR